MRVLKAKRFAREARKAGITDAELLKAASEIARGQCDALGGNVFKKRLRRNGHRALVLLVTDDAWIYQYLFAKKDRANIGIDELDALRKLARDYASVDRADIDELVTVGDLELIGR